MPFFAPLIQEINAKQSARIETETLILLDEQDRVIGLRRGKTKPKAAVPLEIGDHFFSRFPVTSRDQEALRQCRSELSSHALLMRLADRPVLMLCHFFNTAGITLAVFPHGEVAELFDRPALYFGRFDQLLFAPSALLRREPVTEQSYLTMSEWLSEVMRPFLSKNRLGATYESAFAKLTLHAMQLAPLFDCHVACDMKDLAHTLLPNLNFAFAYGALVAIMAATYRLCAERSLVLYGTEHLSIGPVLCATFACSDPAPILHELEPLARMAEARANFFEFAVRDGNIEIFFSLCQTEISAQDIKALDGGKTPEIYPVPAPDEILPDAPRTPGGIPLFRDGKWAFDSDKNKE